MPKSQTGVGDKILHIPIGNFILLSYHTKGQNKIPDNYNSDSFVIVAHNKDPNVYRLQSLNKKGPKRTVNMQQLFDQKRSQEDQTTAYPSIKGHKNKPKLKKKLSNPKFVTHMALGQRPRQLQYLIMHYRLKLKVNKGAI